MLFLLFIYFSITSISGGLISIGKLSILKNFNGLVSSLSIFNLPLYILVINTVTTLYTSSP